MLPLPKQTLSARYDLALRKIKAGQLDQAGQDLTAILAIKPDIPEAHFQLSVIAHKLGQHVERARHLTRGLELRPQDIPLNEAAVDAFTATGDFDAALRAHDRLIAAEPKNLKRQVDKGMTLQFAADFTAADALFRALIKKNPKVGALYRVYTTTARIPPDDPLMDRMRKLTANQTLPDIDRMHIGFALAKTLESQKKYDQVFGPLTRANALQQKLYPLDRATAEAKNAALLGFQDNADLTPAGPEIPIQSIFVTGMPRSGTTLVEQILASHSQVTAGGEMPYASRLAINLFGPKDTFTPLRDATQSQINDFARGYAQIVRQETGVRSGVVTDKAIQAHKIYGLLHRALRGVRFVVVHRDPRDIALSIYKNHFRIGTHRYANSLSDIAHEIKAFRANIAHWKTLLPDAVHEIRYEDLVADPEPRTRALIAAAGLDWEDACLSFHTSKTAVKTLSLQQVRQPIYSGSVQAWRRYETELAPFIAAWGDDPWD